MKKILLFVAFALSMGVMAQESKPALAEPSSNNAELFQLAATLSRYGYANKSALALIQAAQIVNANNFTEVDLQPEGGSPVVQEDPNKAGYISLDATELLNDARALAGNDKNLLALIDQAEQAGKVRGAVGGPRCANDRVLANSRDVYTIKFRGGEVAEVAVIGDGDTDLDLYIYDQNNNLVASDTDYTDRCYVRWTPAWTGNFKIVIVNRGSVYNRYYMETN